MTLANEVGCHCASTTSATATGCKSVLSDVLPMRRADDEAAAGRAALAATATTGLVKLLVAGAAEPGSGLEHGDMVKVGNQRLEAPHFSVAARAAVAAALASNTRVAYHGGLADASLCSAGWFATPARQGAALRLALGLELSSAWMSRHSVSRAW